MPSRVKKVASFELFRVIANPGGQMKRGPKPKPYLVKLAEGNPGKRPLNPGAQLPPKPFGPPIPLDPVALREWDRIMAFGFWLRESESVGLADRCLCFSRMLEAEDHIRRTGFTVISRGREISNPAVRVAKGYRDAMSRWDAELYLKPFAEPGV
jgi:phage terminase small subunit